MKKAIKFLHLVLVTGLVFYFAGPAFCGEEAGSAEGETAHEAVAQVAEAERDMPGVGRGQMIKSTIVIILVLGLLIGANVFIKKRAGTFKGLGGARIKVLERRSIDTKRALFLISADGKKLLIGVGPQHIEALCEFNGESGSNISGVEEDGKESR